MDKMIDKIVTDITELRKLSSPTDVQKCVELNIFNRLEAALKASPIHGLGLAAIQLGIPIQAAIIRIPPNKGPSKQWECQNGLSLNLINPRIEERNGLYLFENEGCLSFPGKYVKTRRHWEITASDDYNNRRYVLTGIEAAVFQHEIDHTNYGLTILDRMQKPIMRETEKIGRNERCEICDIKYKNHKPETFNNHATTDKQ
jgi:peptide deformylase